MHIIMRQRTVIYTPQQNGIAKKINRTILNKVRCILLISDSPRLFWGKVVKTVGLNCY